MVHGLLLFIMVKIDNTELIITDLRIKTINS